ncbi:phage N-6-adenine-methyltransferase [Svornostia abyssi]|uniref:Phage N-6-adenine-methyltransferase n=1 Tax=Svornostia abyssi TaxID=2898438 RepID=A0ABY5PA20_9ACTN|nr:phage N-6-adenine-methyltransferase [Parviterribacteraceae bacterium J379]
MSARYDKLTVGSSVEWYTPPEIFQALGLRFDLDVCAPPGGLPWIPAERSFSRADDGLTQPWQGLVWMNPPYGRGIDLWMRKLADHGSGIALVHARTDTQWWREATAAATAICFIAGRVRFVRGATMSNAGPGSPTPSVLLAYGQTCALALLQANLGPTLLIPGGLKPHGYNHPRPR